MRAGSGETSLFLPTILSLSKGAEGTPEDVAKVERSYTGQYLKETLARSERVESGPAIKFAKGKTRASKRERETAE
jgi:hypothetical protein